MPPLCVTAEQLQRMIAAVQRALQDLARHC
jgi:adenosylmethionine-8-amino-7-oxononanoate aminotransferase